MQLELPLSRTDYCIRESKRVRNMQLSVSPTGNIEVIVPKGTDPGIIPKFVNTHNAWLNNVLWRIRQKRPVSLDNLTPAFIEFAAVKEFWQVQYHPARRNYFDVTLNSSGGKLLTVYSRDKQQINQLLNLWLTQQAKEILIPWLQNVSREIELPFHNASVRAQKTRWGSCSVRKHISLNRSLLFLKPHLVRYLFVHELCHTVHLNHSKRYWNLVSNFEPQYLQHEQEMNQCVYFIPRWAAH